MSRVRFPVDLDDVEIGRSGSEAALRLLERITVDKDEIAQQWQAAIRIAQANGASLREIAQVAKVSPQTVANIVNR